MADLKPIGSEKLTGQDKLNRIMEIARFKEVLHSPVNETARSEYSINLADGNNYQIVKEKMGYIIKKTISESVSEYIDPMKNRKYFPSYSQALKRLNLMAKEVNRLHENDEGVSLFGEQKKFVLKSPKPNPPAAEAPAVPSEPPPVPSPELPPSPNDAPMPSDSELDAAMGAGDDMPDDVMGDEPMGDDMGGDSAGSDDVTFKSVQKLTGKLTQKMRAFDNEKGMTSEDIKYVINMVLSAADLEKLSDEDREDILSKFESDEIDGEMGDFDGGDEEDITSDDEVEDIQADMDIPMESEIDEEMYGSFGNMRRKDFKGDMYYDEKDRPAKDSEIYGIGGDDFDTEEFDSFQKLYDKYGDNQRWFGKDDGESMFNKYKETTGRNFKVKTKKPKMDSPFESEDFGYGSILDSIFSESKVDKVLSKYFDGEAPKKKKVNLTEHKKSKLVLESKMKSVKNLSESFEQENSSKKFLEENSEYIFVGKTNLKNLVFEHKTKQVKISPDGIIL